MSENLSAAIYLFPSCLAKHTSTLGHAAEMRPKKKREMLVQFWAKVFNANIVSYRELHVILTRLRS